MEGFSPSIRGLLAETSPARSESLPGEVGRNGNQVPFVFMCFDSECLIGIFLNMGCSVIGGCHLDQLIYAFGDDVADDVRPLQCTLGQPPHITLEIVKHPILEKLSVRRSKNPIRLVRVDPPNNVKDHLQTTLLLLQCQITRSHDKYNSVTSGT